MSLILAPETWEVRATMAAEVGEPLAPDSIGAIPAASAVDLLGGESA